MIAAIVTALLSAWILGLLLLATLWPRSRSFRGDLSLLLPLGFGVGLAATSVSFFYASLVVSRPIVLSALIDGAWATTLIVVLWRRGARALPAPATRPPATAASWCFGAMLALAGAAAVPSLVHSFRTEPYGAWDASAIWNMHARFIFRSGLDWWEGIDAPAMAWAHFDYPLLLPASVARIWSLAGRESPLAPATVSVAFAVATVWLLVAAASRVRSRTIAPVGGLLLVTTPLFASSAITQYADIPLGFYILAATVVTVVTHDEHTDGGAFAIVGGLIGMAAWTKNEGLLFALAGIVAWQVILAPAQRGLAKHAFWVGLAACLLPVLQFKATLAPANDVASTQSLGHLHLLADPSRYRTILNAFGRELMRFGQWTLAPYPVMALCLLGRGARQLSRHEASVGLVLALMLAGYFGVYLITPRELAWHLDSSLPRLLLQLWPTTILLWCLAASAPPTSKPASSASLIREDAAVSRPA